MAATKKAAAIAEQKLVLVAEIEKTFLTGHKSLGRVPDFVNCGSHQIALAWRNLVEKYFSQPGFTIPERTSLKEMQAMCAEWKKRLDQLTGKTSLVECDTEDSRDFSLQ